MFFSGVVGASEHPLFAMSHLHARDTNSSSLLHMTWSNMPMDGEQDGGRSGERPQPLGVLCGSELPSFARISENMLEVTKSGSVLGWTLADGLAGMNDSAPRESYFQAVGLTLTRCGS